MKESEPDAQLGRAILGEDLLYNSAEVAAETGLTLDQARRLWRALGFPEAGGAKAFTQSDVTAVSTLVDALEGGLVDFDLAVTLTRAVGQTMAKLADWEVAALVRRVESLVRQDGATETRMDLGLRIVDEISQPFEALLIYAWRRHAAAAASRMEAMGAEDGDLHTVQLTVGFADIVSFTALSNDLAHHRIGDLVEVFESRCADVVAGKRGRVIKTIGDSVLFVNDDPVAGYDTAEGIINVIGRDSRMPDVRVGLASGPVLMRLGDVFGPPVNLAARMTAVARRNRIIIDAATAAMLPEDRFETRRLPGRPVRGFGVVEPVAVRRH